MTAMLPRFTPGKFTALWVILRSLRQLGEGVTEDELLSYARRSGLRAGGLPVGDGLALARAGDFIVVDDRRVHTARTNDIDRDARRRDLKSKCLCQTDNAPL